MDINYRRYTDALDSFKNKDKTFFYIGWLVMEAQCGLSINSLGGTS